MDEECTPPAGPEPKRPRRAERNGRKRKQPRKVSPEYLENSALHYLERFASSAANLKRVLMRKVMLSASVHDTDPDEGAAWVDALIERYQRAGLLDDGAYAAMRARSINRQGGPERAIRAKLAAKGVAAEHVDAAVDELREDVGGDPDMAAAVALARRRGFGPFRRPSLSAKPLPPEERRMKELAAMARAGFSFDTATRVIDAERPEDLDEDMAAFP
ncbi:regulatory protein RecX [Caenispirillum salinarum]|uniref:regulatory protein RecX n=1 Tax=Caenispirillum salinarum TaxID=859058 RepID=UPI0009FC6857|nr:regulatory protein RecX [Caenispirillum salinarum]